MTSGSRINWKSMELLERDQYLAEFEAMLGEVAEGTGRFILVSGEAGIGKTSLVERFAETHKDKVRVLWGSCDALFTPRALGPLYDIVVDCHKVSGSSNEMFSDFRRIVSPYRRLLR